jgi:small subunit ribosomal protein S1
MESAGQQATGRATRRLRAGEIVPGLVIQISHDSVFVDVGMPSDGRIARAELTDRNGTLRVAVGDTVRATVVDPKPDGPVLAVMLGHGGHLDTASLEMAKESGSPIAGEVSRVIKGGLEVQIGQTRAFCPASQAELGHVADLSVYVGQTLEFKVIDVREGGRNVVVSRRALLEDRRREAMLGAKDRLVLGSEVEGTVQALGRHGAVVDLDGIEGFIHLSELAPHRVERAEDVLRPGERVTARVLSIEDSPKGLRIRLSLRAMQAQAASNAPAQAQQPLPVDEVYTGSVTRAASFGVFVQTPIGEGLVPLRELGLAPGADHRRAYPAGRELKVVVVNRAGGKLTLSATQVARVEERKNYREFTSAGTAPSGASSQGLGSLGDVLRKKFTHLPAPSEADSPAPSPPASAPAAARPESRNANSSPQLERAPSAPVQKPVPADTASRAPIPDRSLSAVVKESAAPASAARSSDRATPDGVVRGRRR